MKVTATDMALCIRQVIGTVRVLNELNWKARGAEIYATWTLPDGSSRLVEGTTNSFGLAEFVINKARKGTCSLTIDDVVMEDHPFDIENSVLSASFFKKRRARIHVPPGPCAACPNG